MSVQIYLYISRCILIEEHNLLIAIFSIWLRKSNIIYLDDYLLPLNPSVMTAEVKGWAELCSKREYGRKKRSVKAKNIEEPLISVNDGASCPSEDKVLVIFLYFDS